ncbi:MAG: hypothetical protein AAB415_01420 [Patescibacteria group bacterium]
MSDFVATNDMLDRIMTKICDRGSDFAECVCGRTTFNGGYQTYEGDDLTLGELRKRTATKNSMYLEVDYTIPVADLPWGGVLADVVVGCPCGIVIKVAKQWLGVRWVISDFFAEYARLVQEELISAETIASTLGVKE